MLISPTEPAELKRIGTVNLLPERYGSDLLFPSKIGLVGIQRKEVNDLLASMKDGRLGKELVQMQQLPCRLLIIEGRLQWTADGLMLGPTQFSLAQFQGLLWSVQSQGCWITYTGSLQETIGCVLNFEKFCRKHLGTNYVSSLVKKKEVKNEWGLKGSREWGVGLLMHFGLGPILASRVYDEFGVPLEWTVNDLELQQVDGIGKGRAEKMIGSLRGVDKTA